MHVGIANPRLRGNIPGIPGACAMRNITYLTRGSLGSYWFSVSNIENQHQCLFIIHAFRNSNPAVICIYLSMGLINSAVGNIFGFRPWLQIPWSSGVDSNHKIFEHHKGHLHNTYRKNNLTTIDEFTSNIPTSAQQLLALRWLMLEFTICMRYIPRAKLPTYMPRCWERNI